MKIDLEYLTIDQNRPTSSKLQPGNWALNFSFNEELQEITAPGAIT